MVCISLFFSPCLTAVALTLLSFLRPRCTHPRGARFAGALFETLVSPAGTRFTDALSETLAPRAPLTIPSFPLWRYGAPAIVVHFQPMSSLAAARSSTFNPCRTLRRRQAPLSTHIESSGCTAPICVRRPSSTSVPSFLSGPFRAPRGRLPGATVAPPPGMGWTLRTGISPRGPPKVARGEVPKVPDCRTTDSFWGPFWYPLFRPTCTQFYEK